MLATRERCRQAILGTEEGVRIFSVYILRGLQRLSSGRIVSVYRRDHRLASFFREGVSLSVISQQGQRKRKHVSVHPWFFLKKWILRPGRLHAHFVSNTVKNAMIMCMYIAYLSGGAVAFCINCRVADEKKRAVKLGENPRNMTWNHF